MKKLIIVFLLLSANNLWAQSKWKIQLGVRGGVNLAQLHTGNFVAERRVNGRLLADNIKESFKTRTGYVAGGYVRIGGKFYLQPEVILSAKGGSINILRDATDPSDDVIEINYTNIDVPLLLGYRLGPVRISAGPLASFNVRSGQSLNEAIKSYTDTGTANAFKNAYYGYQAGAGLDIGKLSLDVRYEGSLSDVSFVDLSNQVNFSQKANLWQITLGIRLLNI
ncbi:porin family protein [Runella sp.]|uniref:porin family protein n=1 Tax=Runella sp. TaxID=1960881 RepID=UPI003D11EA6B